MDGPYIYVTPKHLSLKSAVHGSRLSSSQAHAIRRSRMNVLVWPSSSHSSLIINPTRRTPCPLSASITHQIHTYVIQCAYILYIYIHACTAVSNTYICIYICIRIRIIRIMRLWVRSQREKKEHIVCFIIYTYYLYIYIICLSTYLTKFRWWTNWRGGVKLKFRWWTNWRGGVKLSRFLNIFSDSSIKTFMTETHNLAFCPSLTINSRSRSGHWFFYFCIPDPAWAT